MVDSQLLLIKLLHSDASQDHNVALLFNLRQIFWFVTEKADLQPVDLRSVVVEDSVVEAWIHELKRNHVLTFPCDCRRHDIDYYADDIVRRSHGRSVGCGEIHERLRDGGHCELLACDR